MSGELHLSKSVFSDDEHCMRTVGNVIVTYTRAPPSPAYLDAWAEEAAKVVRECGDFVVYTVISSSAAAPSEEAKSEIRKVMTRYKERIRGVAYAVEGTGFAAAAMRSALALISLVARYPYPQKIFSTAGEASAWIAGLSPLRGSKAVAVAGSQLDTAVEAMRAELERRCAKAG